MNPLRVAEKAFGIGAGVAGAVVRAARGALGRSGGDEREAPERRAPKPSITDNALADKVQSVLFSDSSIPKGKIDVNAVGRDVYLRGEAGTPDMIKDLERRARAIPEVARVENLLHLPKTPAPSRADTPKRAQKTRRTKAAPARRAKPKKVNAEARRTVGETPAEQAAKGEGRKVAPMGSGAKKAGGSATKPGGSAKKAGGSAKKAGGSAKKPG